MPLIKKLWHSFSNAFGATVFHPQFFSYRYLRSDMKGAVKYAKGALADIGCGAKPYKKFLAPVVSHYFSFDYPESPESADSTIKVRPEAYANAIDLPIKGGNIDTVILTKVLEHIPEPRLTTNEVSRILKDDGVLIMSVPMLYPIHSAPYDFFRYTSYGIKELLTKSGLSIIEMRENGGATATLALFANLFMMHKLFALSGKKLTVPISLVLAPVVFLLSTIFNLAAYILQPVDTDRRFTLNYYIVAKKAA